MMKRDENGVYHWNGTVDVPYEHKTFKIVLGQPIPASTFDDSRKPVEWAAWVREKVYQL